MSVKITKLISLANAKARTPSWSEYKIGQDNGNISLPKDYTVEGTLLYPIEVGLPVSVLRTKRNGVEVRGIFQSSIVTEITQTGFKTQNSEYTLENL